ncbi:DUF2293 domain-containing protein [Telmatospirillum sp. J64-1]|uniref:DUF2293 domain-containing protein n=1 Tax=Telmatospirillum sp. J64-1 TaxID=2502183 RepID=UPI00115CD750|nr:DUF2293 domain-containing protein [Telmatospirillum sp. J64-1]
MKSARHHSLETVLHRLFPRIAEQDARAIADQAASSKGLRHASPEAAAWLSALSYIRHNFTDYDDLLAEGYDVDSARHFVAEQMNLVLAEWGSRRRVGGEE